MRVFQSTLHQKSSVVVVRDDIRLGCDPNAGSRRLRPTRGSNDDRGWPPNPLQADFTSQAPVRLILIRCMAAMNRPQKNNISVNGSTTASRETPRNQRASAPHNGKNRLNPAVPKQTRYHLPPYIKTADMNSGKKAGISETYTST